VSDAAALTLADAAQALRRRDLSPEDLLRACRARIERWQPRINAFVSQEPRNSGREGPLGGIPLAHKDMFYRSGRVSNCGSKIRRGWVAGETSAALERLDAAGALDIGTLNMSEFAYGPTGHNEHCLGEVDRRMPEHPRQEHRQDHDLRALLRHEGDHLAEGHLGNLPFAEAREAVEDLLDRQLERHEVDARRPHLARDHVAHVVVGVERERE
jgi:hypothetical protein